MASHKNSNRGQPKNYHKPDSATGLIPFENPYKRYSKLSSIEKDKERIERDYGIKLLDRDDLWTFADYDYNLESFYVGDPALVTIVESRRTWDAVWTQRRELGYCNRENHWDYAFHGVGPDCVDRSGTPFVFQDWFLLGRSVSERGRSLIPEIGKRHRGCEPAYMARILRRSTKEVEQVYWKHVGLVDRRGNLDCEGIACLVESDLKRLAPSMARMRQLLTANRTTMPATEVERLARLRAKAEASRG